MATNKFKENLSRSFRDIRADKAEAIAEDVETSYRRKIEDLCHDIRANERYAENIILDLCPSSTTSTSVVPSNFDPNAFVASDYSIAKNHYNNILELKIMLDRYESLFGEFPDADKIKKVYPEYSPKTAE